MNKVYKIFSFSSLIIFLTGANLIFLYVNHIKKKEKIQEQAPISRALFEVEKEEQILLDESKVIGNRLHDQENNSSRPTYIILRFSFQNCDLCTESIFNHLEELCKSASIKPENVMLLGTFYSNRDAILLNSRKNMPYKVVSVKRDHFSFELEKDATYPFFFVSLPDGTARHFFIPTKENLQRTQRYLEIIKQRYFIE